MGPAPEHPIHQPGGGLPKYGYTFDKQWSQCKQDCKPLSGDFDGQLVEQCGISRTLFGALDIELERSWSQIMQPKYSQPEIERRWLVAVDEGLRLPEARARRIEDKYLSGGRLRLRKVSEENCEPIFKLGKKYLRREASPESVVSIYLTESEFKAFFALPGRVATKIRYSVEGGALDVYEHPNHEQAIFEFEFESERAAAEYIPPEFVREEVTLNEKYTGFALCEEAP